MISSFLYNVHMFDDNIGNLTHLMRPWRLMDQKEVSIYMYIINLKFQVTSTKCIKLDYLPWSYRRFEYYGLSAIVDFFIQR